MQNELSNTQNLSTGIQLDTSLGVLSSGVLSSLTEDQSRRLTELLDRYLCNLENGTPTNLDALTSEHPDLVEVMAVYVEKLNALYGFAAKTGCSPSGVVGLMSIADRPFKPFQLGDFEILSEIGRGGMGLVYLANQRSLKRRVALKLLPMAATLDQKQIARFKNESQAAGQLHHPNIVSIFNVGVEQGIHFYAMQFIDGVALDHWVEQRKLANKTVTKSSSILDWRMILGWAVDVAEALQVAHENGIVHRDIKPSNLMLDESGKIWVTDFGLARFQTEMSLTGSGDLLGTIRYMSPEQATGRAELVDHRTDIYSLAATLFELLTLRAVITGDDGLNLLRKIEQEDPPRLDRLNSHVPSDLTFVLQKAMSKRKDERYATSAEFADDLRAVLHGRATVAQPPTFASQLIRWTSRHQKSVATAACFFLLATIGMGIGSWVVFQKNRELQFSERQVDLYLDQARSTVDRLGTRVAQQLSAVPGAEQVRESLLQETLEYYQRFVTQAADDPSLQAELALTYSNIGALVNEMRSASEALRHFERSASIYSALGNSNRSKEFVNDENEQHKLLSKSANNLNLLGLAYVEVGRVSDALIAYQNAIAIDRKVLEKYPDDIESATTLALAINNYALALAKSGKLHEAKVSLENAISRFDRLSKSAGTDHETIVRGLAAALSNLSSLYLDTDAAKASRLLEEALQIRAGILAESSSRLRSSAELANLYNSLGVAHVRTEHFVEAKEAFDTSIRLNRQVVSLAPSIAEYQCDLAMSLNNLAMLFQKQERHRDAAELTREAIGLQKEILVAGRKDAQMHCRLGAMQHNLAVSLLFDGSTGDAKRELRQAIDQQTLALSLAPNLSIAKTYLLQHQRLAAETNSANTKRDFYSDRLSIQ